MKARLPVLIKDPAMSRDEQLPLTENHSAEEDFFLDGPVSGRVAVIDFDPASGEVHAGTPFEPHADPEQPGRYPVANPGDEQAPDFIQTTVFGGVLKTMHLFEEADTLGRRLTWAFPGPQLLVVPRAGEWANAFYERDSRSLQFFYFRANGGGTIHTCHSQDIIAHETTHAILDGVAPDLYNALTPQSLALHEAVADLVTLLMAFRSRKLAERVLDRQGGSIEEPSAFTSVAGQFGAALDSTRHALRNLYNAHRLGDPGLDPGDPHALSQVLSGALYSVMVRIHESLKEASAEGHMHASAVIEPVEVEQWRALDRAATAEFYEKRQRSASRDETRRISAGRALWVASQRFKRTILRALDYLPPGDVTFADYGRAIIASDQASHPGSGEQRDWLRAEFAARGIVRDATELDVRTSFEVPEVAALEREALVESDWLAYDFANRNRALLSIPPDVPFAVRPRRAVEKTYYYHEGALPRRECLFKVSWTEREPQRLGSSLPSERLVRRGTTLAIDWESGRVNAIVTTADRPDGEDQRAARDRMLARLCDEDAIALGDQAAGPDGKPLRGALRGEVVEGALRVRGMGRLLHATEVG